MPCSYFKSQPRLFQDMSIIFCHFQEHFHWYVEPKYSLIDISSRFRLHIFPRIFPPNPRKTHIMAKRLLKSVKRLQERPIILSPWPWRPSWTPFWILKHDDVIKLIHFPRNWPFVRGIHRSFHMICVWTNGWVSNPDASDLKCRGAHYGVTVMKYWKVNSTYQPDVVDVTDVLSCRIKWEKN